MHPISLVMAMAASLALQPSSISVTLPKAPAAGVSSIAAKEAEDRKVVCKYIASTGAHLAGKACRTRRAWDLLATDAKPSPVDIGLRQPGAPK